MKIRIVLFLLIINIPLSVCAQKASKELSDLLISLCELILNEKDNSKTVEEQTKIVDMFEDINHFITLHQRESIFAFINKGHNTSVSDTTGNYINVTNPIK